MSKTHKISKRLYYWAKRLSFPGLDLHTRCRYRMLSPMIRKGSMRTLDAGCSNGYLTYAAYRRGNKVLGVDLDGKQVTKNIEFYRWLGCSGMQFEVCDIYELSKLGQRFDQIICSETLEHIVRDDEVIRTFAEILTDNGLLHLCSPYALHPHHNLGRINEPETGGHVRDGYTLESYKALLKPAGFTILHYFGLGSKFLYRADQVIRVIRNHLGDIAAFPIYLILGWPALWIDTQTKPEVPFSVYVQAIKKV